MKFENKGKWVKQINEAQGATLNGTDDIELEFDSRHSKVYITINGDLTYVVDEDKFNDNVSDFIYDEVNKDKTKFNLNWFKHFGKLNRYLRKVESQKNEDDYIGNDKYIVIPVSYIDKDIRILDKRTGEFLKDKAGKNLKFASANDCKHYINTLESVQKNENDLSISAMLDFSLSEENDAVANYEKRAAKCLEHGNIKLANLFKELARDEKVHVAQLTKAKELLGLVDNEIEQEGSDEAKEILVESSQKNESEKITKDDVLKFLEKNNYHTKKNVKITKKIAEQWSLKDLACFIALDSMRFRNPKDAIENANLWIEDGKDAILKQWFGKQNAYNL